MCARSDQPMKFIFLFNLIFADSLLPCLSTFSYLNDSMLYNMLIAHENNEYLTDDELHQLEFTMLRKRANNEAPSSELLSLYRGSVLTEANRFRISTYQFDGDLLWKIWMEELLVSLSTLEIVNQLEHYAELGLNPLIFSWYMWSSLSTSYFEQNGRYLQSHPHWNNLWHRALTVSLMYLHGRVATTIKLPSQLRLNLYDEPVHPGEFMYYRAEAIQLVYNYMIMEITLGILPSQLSQVVEFGGGTGLNAPLLQVLGFKGTHFVYDMYPMCILQQYFHRYSGWPSYLGNKLYDADMRHAESHMGQDDVEYLRVSGGNNMRGRNIILESNHTHLLYHLNTSDLSNSLFFATYSITETPLDVRDSFLSPFVSPESRFGYYYIQLASRFSDVDNIAWITAFAIGLNSTHNSCLWKNRELDLFTFVAKAVSHDTPNDNAIPCHTFAGCSLEKLVFCNSVSSSQGPQI